MANADINPPPTLLKSHPALQPLLANTAISARFAQHETAAVKAKKWYTRLGVFSLAAIFTTMASLVVALTFAPPFAESRWFTVALGALGALGVGAQIGLLATPLKQRWLSGRYAAERLRCIKFQAFAYAAGAGNEQGGLRYTDAAIGRLEVELDKPFAAMQEFEPATALGEAPPTSGAMPPALLAELVETYRVLRLDYQINHARHCINQIKEESRLPAAASEISFWFGAALGYIDLILGAYNLDQGATLRQFLTLFLFVLSALLFVLERGRSHGAALERYEDYAKKLAAAGRLLDRATTPADFIDAVRETEAAALQELQAFCREARKSTYLF